MSIHSNNLAVTALFFIMSALLALVLWWAGLSCGRAAFASVNAATFGLYGVDKYQAARMGYRIPEIILHWAALIGGTPGAAFGQMAFRHKTRKRSFRVVFLAIAVAQAIALTVYWTFVRYRT